jgi:hypothetical protein
MKAIVISPSTQSIETVDVASLDDVKAIVGYDTLESDAIGALGDRLYFDEECFLRGTSGRFQIDSVIPVAGKGVIVGTVDGGATLRDVVTDADDLRQRIRYL